jgi:4-hydroxy-tetrahydrodipicolinate synthase
VGEPALEKKLVIKIEMAWPEKSSTPTNDNFMDQNRNPFNRRRFIGTLAAAPLAFTAAMAAAHGLSPLHAPVKAGRFVPVMITPYHDDGSIDFDHLDRLVDFYLACGAKGLFANCLSSEMYSLKPEERLALASHVVKRVKGKVPVVACGSFGDTLEQKAEFTKKMHDQGVQAVILITGHFAEEKESDEVLVDNFRKFFKLTGKVPLGTYECPSPYKRLLTPAVIKTLIAEDRLIYHKDTSLDIELVRAKLAVTRGTKLEFFDAHAPNAMNSLRAGAAGMSAIAGNCYPDIFAWMCANATDPAKKDKVEWLQKEITRMDDVVSQHYSRSARYFLQKRGLTIRELTRTNPTPLNDAEKKVLDNAYDTYLGWCRELGITSVRGV